MKVHDWHIVRIFLIFLIYRARVHLRFFIYVLGLLIFIFVHDCSFTTIRRFDRRNKEGKLSNGRLRDLGSSRSNGGSLTLRRWIGCHLSISDLGLGIY